MAEAMAIIQQNGIEKLSLREVARRVGVSHQAPYRHFPTRDHVLAEVVRRAFLAFAAALRSAPQTDNPAADSRAMGVAYVTFALTQPLYYQLIFGGTLPDPDQHPGMMDGSRDAFDLLRSSLARVFVGRGETRDKDAIEREAMFVWSSLHGVVSLMRTDAMKTVDISPETRAGFAMEALQRVGIAAGIIPPTAYPGDANQRNA